MSRLARGGVYKPILRPCPQASTPFLPHLTDVVHKKLAGLSQSLLITQTVEAQTFTWKDDSGGPMERYFSNDVVQGLQAARSTKRNRHERLCVHVGGQVFPILRLTDDGFEVRAENTPNLRGLVDVFNGPAHLWQCLILRADHGDAVTRYEYKRQTRGRNAPARDYAEAENAPVALLTKE